MAHWSRQPIFDNAKGDDKDGLLTVKLINSALFGGSTDIALKEIKKYLLQWV